MALSTLSVDLEARTAKFAEDMGKAARIAEQNGAAIAKAMGVAQSALGGLAAAFSVDQATTWFRSMVDGVDALNDVADATGASIENISALEDVAARTGHTFDNVGAALVKFNKLLSDAKPGSDAEAGLKAFNLNAQELRRLDPAEALLRYTRAIATFADDGEKARLVQEQLGKSYRELAPFLKDLADKGELVAKVTTEQADAADKFNKQLSELAKNSLDAKRALVGDLVQGINEAAAAFKKSGLLEGIRTLFTGSDEYKNNKRLTELTNDLVEAENALSAARARDAQYGDKSLASAAAEKRVASIRAELTSVQAYRKLLEDSAAKPPDVRPTVTPPKPVNTTKPDTSAATYLASLEKQFRATTGAASVYADVQEHLALNGDKFSASQKAAAQALGQQIDAYKRRAQMAEEAVKGTQAQESAADAQRAAIAAELDARRLLADQMAFENTLLNRSAEVQTRARFEREQNIALVELEGRILADNALSEFERIQALAKARRQAARAAAAFNTEQANALDKAYNPNRGVSDAFKDYAEQAAKAGEAAKAATQRIFGSLEDGLTTLFSKGKLDTQSFVDTVIAEFTRLKIVRPLLDDILSRSGTAASLLSKILGQGGGSFVPDAGLAANAADFGKLIGIPSFEGGGPTGSGSRSGGVDGRGGFLSILHPDETVIDHTRTSRATRTGASTGSATGGANVTVNIIESPTQAGTQQQRQTGSGTVIDVFVAQVKSAIASDIARGQGAIPDALGQRYALNPVPGAY